MIDYKKILRDTVIINEYKKIDKQNQHSFNHGMKHIQNVVEIIYKLSDVLNIDEEVKNNLLIASVLHDVGQVDCRDNHGLKGRNFAEKYLEGKIDQTDLCSILEAIEFHSQIDRMYDLPLFSNIICFADKMDFTVKRLEKDYKNIYGYIVCENVTDVKFNYNKDSFCVSVSLQGIADEKAKELLLARNSFKKAIQVTIALSNKLNVKPELYIGNINLDLNKI